MKVLVALLVAVATLIAESHAGAALRTHATSYQWNGRAFAVPLTIKDNSGVIRKGWPVTMGVPLPRGVVSKIGHLRLTDANGNEIPCQFQVLSRYWALDNSVRWVLLDFQIDLAANATRQVVLRNDRPPQPIRHPIRISETSDATRINTGAIMVTVPRHNGHLFQTVSIGGHDVIEAGVDDGPEVLSGDVPAMERFHGPHWNTHGWEKIRTMEPIHIREAEYRAVAPRQVTIETAGPMRTVIRIRGTHRASESGPGIIENGLYNYTVRLHFYRGQSFVHVQYDIENSSTAQPQWQYLFHEAGLSHSLRLHGPVIVTAGGRTADNGPTTMSSVHLFGGQHAWLYQSAPVVGPPKYGRPNIHEGGFRFGIGKQGAVNSPLITGSRARFLDTSDATKGVSVAMRYFWEEAPRAISASSKRLHIAVLADSPGHQPPAGGHRPRYDLDFGERFINDLLYYFHKGGAKTAHVADIAEAFEYPLAAHAPPAWYADTETWYFELSRTPGKADRHADTDKHWFPNSVGPKHHGYDRSYNSGGNHESLNSGWLGYIRSGKLADWERNLVLSRWTIAHNPGWAYRNNILHFGHDQKRFSALDAQIRQWNRLTGFGPKDFYLWRSGKTYVDHTRRGPVVRPIGGWSYLNRYKWLPDYEHYALFRLFEYYYLTGDRRALDSIYGFVNWDINFEQRKLFRGKTRSLSDTNYFREDPDALRRGHYSRVFTWMLYTNIAGFQATGDPVYDLYARWQIRRALGLLRQRHGQFTNWTDKHETDAEGRPIYQSRAQTWMEAQGVLALHEAYKTYRDERILDGLWGQADYFAHHVLFFPRLGMLNNRTSMPNERLGTGTGHLRSLTPYFHDRLLQAFPLLYYYTGWPGVAKRYAALQKYAHNRWIRAWFLQTGLWLNQQHPKHSLKPPDRISDLRVLNASRNGVTLRWTSPHDDGPTGHAFRYFVKYSTKPIVDFAPMDNPTRAANEARIVTQAENIVIGRMKGKKRPSDRDLSFNPGDTAVEPNPAMLADPRWHDVDAFWMAEHVTGEPKPAPAGTEQTFTVRQLHPHNWFGLDRNPTIADLPAGRYYFAICSWDTDHNLSRVSNVVAVDLH